MEYNGIKTRDDKLIAAHALLLNVILVTRNTEVFRFVMHLKRY
jgi:predicted nucleic acid-binding protein